MPQLILSPWETVDSIALERAAGQHGWPVERLQKWQAPDHLKSQTELVIFGEALFVRFLADQLNIALLEPPPDWSTALSQDYLKRDVRCITLEAARQIDHRPFSNRQATRHSMRRYINPAMNCRIQVNFPIRCPC